MLNEFESIVGCEAEFVGVYNNVFCLKLQSGLLKSFSVTNKGYLDVEEVPTCIYSFKQDDIIHVFLEKIDQGSYTNGFIGYQIVNVDNDDILLRFGMMSGEYSSRFVFKYFGK
jgi:hypothetical protein